MSVASPECTPAFSTCSEMVVETISPSCATASTSISRPPSMNLETTTGWSPDTSPARVRKPVSSSGEYATFIAAPESTYDGRTRHG